MAGESTFGRNRLKRLISNERGATSIDYAMVACAVALAVVTMVGTGSSPSALVKGAATIAGALVGDESVATARPVDHGLPRR